MTERTEPVRTCVGCRGRAAKSDLLRIVVEGTPPRLVPDPHGRLPGRGAHLHPDPQCLTLAVSRRAFGRALRVEGPLDAGLVHAQVSGTRGTTDVPERADPDDERSMSQPR